MASTLFETAIGMCGIAWSDVGVTSVQLPEATLELTRQRLLAKAREPDEAPRSRPPLWVLRAIARLRRHLGGRPQKLSRIPLDFTGIAPFHSCVFRALLEVPSGATISYGELAKAVGSPGAARAVGRAMGANPFPLIVPCHRVLAAGGKAGGFSAHGGVATKERLLALEGAVSSRIPREAGAQTSLFERATPQARRCDGGV
jgi:methylated-DNA-[protein]-cysteine S-methyltransferase